VYLDNDLKIVHLYADCPDGSKLNVEPVTTLPPGTAYQQCSWCFPTAERESPRRNYYGQ
jgi:hypothetical protein